MPPPIVGVTHPRRAFLSGAALSGLVVAAPSILRAQPSSRGLVPTPRQTAGPFYPVQYPADSDGDLVVLRGAQARAEGQVIHLRGRVLGREGGALPGVSVEIWQCDARGLYRHPGDRPGQRDGAFQGFGRVRADSGGAFAFRTIRPVAYPGRAPHIHVLVRAPGRPLTTQLYVAGDPRNHADGLYASLGREARDAVTMRLGPADGIEAGALVAEIDIVV